MATRLAATLLTVSFLSLIVATLVGLNAGQRLGKSIYEERLDALRSSGSFDVALFVDQLTDTTEALAASPQAAAAIMLFGDDLEDLSDPDLRPPQLLIDDLVEYYEAAFLDPLRADGENIQFRDVASDEPGAVYLQTYYSLPTETFELPILVDDAGDGSEWTETHSTVHPVYRDVVRELDLLDVLLVSADDELVVYSARKGPDLATSLRTGPFSGSVVARAVTRALEDPDAGPVVTDLDFYNGVPNVPIGATAAAVTDDAGAVVGAVALTYAGERYTELLAETEDAATDDDDPIGSDLYLIGADGRTRSDPQPYLDDPQQFLDDSVAAGVLSDEGRAEIERNGTTALVQPAVESTFNDGVDGDSDISRRTSMTGADVVGTVSAVPLEQLEWYISAEIGVSVAESATEDFREVLIVGSAIFVIVVAFLAVWWANGVMQPVRAISDRLGRRGEESPPPLDIPDRSPIEFHRLAASFRAMTVSLRRQRDDLATARADRLATMEQLLPASVAKRIADGNVDTLDEVPQATVVVVVVLGLGSLVQRDDGSSREMIDRLHSEIDDVAFEHGIDRIKVVGDAYFGSCGHDRPYIDHAPRVIAFAHEVIELVDELSEEARAHEAGVELAAAIGAHTGAVTVGLSGGARLVYDVWGETVTTAHHLARCAHADEVLVSDATRSMLPDSFEVVAVDDDSWRVIGRRSDERSDRSDERVPT